MFFRRFETPALAASSYLVGSAGHAAVVDPRRDIDVYLRCARDRRLTITHVFVTHRQEDYVLGSSELAKHTGATIVTGEHPAFGHGDVRVGDGDSVELGDLRLQALHVPGHTPESLCWAVYASDVGETCLGVFTGDTLLVGGTGRVDLLGDFEDNARRLWKGIRHKLAPLGDQALVWPGHGAGSVCGTGLAPRDFSTIGFERAYNPVFTTRDCDAFAALKLDERIPRPPYFAQMEALNLRGGAPMPLDPLTVRILQPHAFQRAASDALIIDTRDPEAFAGGHIPGSHSVWLGGLGLFAGWIAGADSRVLLVLDRLQDLGPAVLALTRIGIDDVAGVLAGGFEAWRDAGLPIERAGAITPEELEIRRDEFLTVDVRDDHEFEQGHIPDAVHVYVGELEDRLREIQPLLRDDTDVAVTCSVGHRGSLAVSLLERHGITRVHNLLGGMTRWNELGLPVDTED